MRVSGLLALCGIVLVTCLGTENEVNAAPVPDPCTIFLNRGTDPPKKTATEAPKAVEAKSAENKNVKVKQFKSLFDEFLSWEQFKEEKKEPAKKEPAKKEPAKKEPAKEEPAKPKAKSIDISTFFEEYFAFLIRLFNLV